MIYPREIIESLTVTYKLLDQNLIEDLSISPPVTHLRLTNLSCGSTYRLMIYASNQAGFSSTEVLLVRTDGSGESIIDDILLNNVVV